MDKSNSISSVLPYDSNKSSLQAAGKYTVIVLSFMTGWYLVAKIVQYIKESLPFKNDYDYSLYKKLTSIFGTDSQMRINTITLKGWRTSLEHLKKKAQTSDWDDLVEKVRPFHHHLNLLWTVYLLRDKTLSKGPTPLSEKEERLLQALVKENTLPEECEMHDDHRFLVDCLKEPSSQYPCQY